jgi:hypothetical protein
MHGRLFAKANQSPSPGTAGGTDDTGGRIQEVVLVL